MTPFFPLLYQILHENRKFFAHFEKFNDFVAILTEHLQILPWTCIFVHWMTPIFVRPQQKSPHFVGAHTEWPPFFRRNLTPNAPYFRSPVGTCTSLSYLSAPPGLSTRRSRGEDLGGCIPGCIPLTFWHGGEGGAGNDCLNLNFRQNFP